jgi:hypothetical protein
MQRTLHWFFLVVFLSALSVGAQPNCAPAGLGTDLAAWFKASEVATNESGQLQLWEDLSVTGLDLSPRSQTSLPTQVEEGLNGRDFLRFDGISQFHSQYPMVFSSRASYTVFMVLRTSPNQFIPNGADVFYFGDKYEYLRLEHQNGSYQAIMNNTHNTGELGVSGQEWTILSINVGLDGKFNVFGNGVSLYAQTASMPPAGGRGSLFLGGGRDVPVNPGANMPTQWAGDIAEFIFVDRALNQAEQRDIETLLAIQYGIHIAPDSYNHFSGSPTSYNHGITGIGRSDSHCYQQMASQSTSLGADSRLHFSNPSDLGDEEFFVWATDSGACTFATQNLNAGDFQAQRLSRNWRVEETGEVGSLNLAFDLTGLGLTSQRMDSLGLLVTTSGNDPGLGLDYANARIILADEKKGDSLFFYGLDLDNGAFFTLGNGLKFKDWDRDGVADHLDQDDDNDGIYDSEESTSSIVSGATEPEADAASWTSDGLEVYTIGNNTNGLGFQESGWEKAIFSRGESDITRESPFATGGNTGSFSKGSLSFKVLSHTFGAFGWSNNTNPLRTSGSEDNQSIQIIPSNGHGSNYRFAIDINFHAGSTVNAFGFDLVDICDNSPAGHFSNYQVLVDGQLVWEADAVVLGDDAVGLVNLKDGEGNPRDSITLGHDLEGFVGIVGATPFSKIQIICENINNPDVAPGVSHDPMGFDNFVMASILDTDKDGTANQYDLDSDNDGIPDMQEAGWDPSVWDQDKDGQVDPIFPVNEVGIVMAMTIDQGAYPAARDSDGDEVADYRDLDSDNDGLSDLIEAGFAPAMFDLDADGVVDGSDEDEDGIANSVDKKSGRGGIFLDLPDFDQDQRANYRDLDSDNDGIGDLIEAGLLPATFDLDLDGVVDGEDTDEDGIVDALDVRTGFGGVAEEGRDTDGDGLKDFIDLDSDNDGQSDLMESGLDFEALDLDLDGVVDGNDSDDDGLVDALDVSTGFGGINTLPDNKDGDKRYDYQDLDSDDDGASDLIESGLDFETLDRDLDGVVDGEDSDNDGIVDALDIKTGPGGLDRKPADKDGDGFRNALDLDSDQDGLTDLLEIGLDINALDTDLDGVVDGEDNDEDGVKDLLEIHLDSTGLSVQPVDTDQDGVPDFLDADSDNDGILDTYEAMGAGDSLELRGKDSDQDGIDDRVDVDQTDGEPFPIEDTDGDGRPNFRDVDSDGDGRLDFDEAWDDIQDGDSQADIDCSGGVDADGDGLLSCFDADDQDSTNTSLLLPPPDDNGYQGVGDYQGHTTAQFTVLSDLFPDNGDRVGVPDFMDNPFDFDGGHIGMLTIALKNPFLGYRVVDGVEGGDFKGKPNQVGKVRVSHFWVDPEGWAHYYHPLQPDQFLFSIRHNKNVTPIDYIELTVDLTDRSAWDLGESRGQFVMARDWNVKTLGDSALVDSLGNPAKVDVRFYFDRFEMDQLLEKAAEFAFNSPEGESGVPRWFKTPDGTDGFDMSYLSDTALSNVIHLGNEDKIIPTKPSTNQHAVGGFHLNGGDASSGWAIGPPDGQGTKINNNLDVYQVWFDSPIPAGTVYRIRVRKDPDRQVCYPEVRIKESSDAFFFYERSDAEPLFVESYSWTDIYLKAQREVIALRLMKGSLRYDDDYELDAITVGEGAPFPPNHHLLSVPVAEENLRYKQFDGITGFSGGTLVVPVTNEPTLLPVEWLYFQAEKADTNIHLYWSTAMEINNQRFEVERSFNGKLFASVGQVMAEEQPSNYQFEDPGAALLQFERIFYRLKQIDLDGGFSYSEVVEVELVESPTPYLSIYPNPVKDKLKVRFIGKVGAEALELQVFSMLGQEMHYQRLQGNGSLQEVEVPVVNWMPGVYLIKLSNEHASKVMKIKIESD